MKTILVMSMKGGVGKTTLAIGLAAALHELGHKTALLDVDVSGSAMPRALGLERAPGYETEKGGRLQPALAGNHQVFSIGLLFPEDEPNSWDGRMRASGVRQILSEDIAWDEDTGYLVVDTPPTSGDEVQALLEHARDVHGAVIVTQPNDLSLLGLRKTVTLLQEAETPVSGMVANMSGYACPHCAQISNPFDRSLSDAEKIAEECGIPYLGAVPLAADAIRRVCYADITVKILGQKPVRFHNKGEGWRRKALGAVMKAADLSGF